MPIFYYLTIFYYEKKAAIFVKLFVLEKALVVVT